MKRVLTPREEAVMHILWRLKRAFVKDILAELTPPRPPYNTISSVVRKLESEGLISHSTYGKTHEYYPVLKKSEYRRQMMSRMLRDYFSDSPTRLLSHFVQEKHVDIAELRHLLDQWQEEE